MQRSLHFPLLLTFIFTYDTRVAWVIFHRYERVDTKYRTTHSELESDS